MKALACRVTVTVIVLPLCATVPDPTVGEEKPVTSIFFVCITRASR